MPSLHYCPNCGTVAFVTPGSDADGCCGAAPLLPLPTSIDKYALSYAVALERQAIIKLIAATANGDDTLDGVTELLASIASRGLGAAAK